MYGHYKNNYDFQISKTSYRELDEYIEHKGEFLLI